MYVKKNKNFYFKYFIKKFYLAGLKLEGWEVKSIKINNNLQIKNSLIIIKSKEFFLKNSFIPINNKNIKSTSNRERKLLLRRNEINEIVKELYKKKIKLLPICIIIKDNFIKIKIATVFKKNEKRMSNIKN